MTTLLQTDHYTIKKLLKEGARKIAPLWPLDRFVAVNPYLGMSDMTFDQAMDFLNKTSDAQATLPTDFYLQAIRTGHMTEGNVAQAISKNESVPSTDVKTFLSEALAHNKTTTRQTVLTLSDVASDINGKKWRRFMVDRISFWASAYFDTHQAIWQTADGSASLYQAWKKEAEVDFSTEAMGLKGFRQLVSSLSINHLEAAGSALEALDLPKDICPAYLHTLLMKMNGWAGVAARVDWDARLSGKESEALEEFLTILLVWEYALMKLLPYQELEFAWNNAKIANETLLLDPKKNKGLEHQLILQQAFDIAKQNSLIEMINNQGNGAPATSPVSAQAVFCIDVRSETFRRNLESVNDGIATLGFAGFFGFPITYVPLGQQEGSDQCPVLIPTSHRIKESIPDVKAEKMAIKRKHIWMHFHKAAKGFKSGAISCFGFVSPLGLYFLPKLFTDLLGITRPVTMGLFRQTTHQNGVSVHIDPADDSMGISIEDRIQMALMALKGMSLTHNFAPIVLIAGHGGNTVNNPHGTGLDCGACGGSSGEANAKVAAKIFNDEEVRAGLRALDINIPESTIFVAGLHDTTTDEVTLFTGGMKLSEGQKSRLLDLKQSLLLAGELTRKERGARMKLTGPDATRQVIKRSKDWSQVRPEWGLAGCSSFIVASRKRTTALDLGGKAFMHSYDWQADEGFKVLEVIMTAPMVVTSWINLQYFASTVDNKRFGAGNKTLHNVVGGLGVLEGFAGDLRTGLPWQSIHDGEKYQHEPNRLNVVIEAPVNEIGKILSRHESIRQLCDNEWIYLLAMNDEGKISHKYVGGLEWELVS